MKSCGKLTLIIGEAQNFVRERVVALRKVEFSFFLYLLQELLVFHENYPPKSEFSVSFQRRVETKSPAQAVMPNFFALKVLDLGKVEFSIFLPAFEFFDFSQKLPSQIWDFGFNV